MILLLLALTAAVSAPVFGAIYGPLSDDDPSPGVKVARVSFLTGEAKLRRADGETWELVTLNLPIVEGDQIAVDARSRLEIQFDKDRHMRLDGNSSATVMTFRDDGIAISLQQGSLNLRIARYDGDGPYFEVDAPGTTIAVRAAGSYRIDALPGSDEVVVAATDGGEARIYSATAGFVLRDGRRARIFLSGASAGEWETAVASRFIDDFDQWSAQRDRLIQQSLSAAHYGRYYDDDIYGADDLAGYGQWTNLAGYGYVWQPYSSSIGVYSNWSPYRYGHWRWVRPWGWVWVNDEPWGWATYHYGRWIYHRGKWYWSPYGYHRVGRSWWYPALVVMTVWGGNVCWYPLPYHYSYFNYNYFIHNHYMIRNGKIRQNWPPRSPHEPQVPGNVPQWTPPVAGTLPTDKAGAGITRDPQINDVVPASGVVSVSMAAFGARQPGAQAPQDVAKALLARSPSELAPPALPAFDGKNVARTGKSIVVPPPANDEVPARATGAAPRTNVKPLDADLQKSVIRGGREPIAPQAGPNSGGSSGIPSGAVDRRKDPAWPGIGAPTVKQPPASASPPAAREPVRIPPTIRDDAPMVKAPPRAREPSPVRNDPPPVRTPPNTQREQPPVRQSPPRYDPPPVKDPPVRSEPPAAKSPPPRPREEAKPAPPPASRSKEKDDGR
jgi:hypothetical protein